MKIKSVFSEKKKGFKGAKCPYCNRSMTSHKTDLYKQNPGLLATFEHVRSQSRDGGNTKDNIWVVCQRCNNLKGDVPFDVFMPFSNAVLKQYPDFPTVHLRKVMQQYILFLAETAVRNQHSKRVAISAALLHINDMCGEYNLEHLKGR